MKISRRWDWKENWQNIPWRVKPAGVSQTAAYVMLYPVITGTFKPVGVSQTATCVMLYPVITEKTMAD